MQWSQLKKRVESRFADSLQGRVQVHAAVYRKPATTDGRAWIVVDGKQIFSAADQPGDAAWRALAAKTEAMDSGSSGTGESDVDRQPEYFATHHDFRAAMEHSLQVAIDEMLESSSPHVRALAMLDRRLGKRRFARLQDIHLEHPLVRTLYELRGRAEGWPLSSGPPSDASHPTDG